MHPLKQTVLDDDLLSFIQECLKWNPKERIKKEELLQHKFLSDKPAEGLRSCASHVKNQKDHFEALSKGTAEYKEKLMGAKSKLEVIPKQPTEDQQASGIFKSFWFPDFILYFYHRIC